jgi:outer membrane lipoprotein-sorting protein
MKSAQRVFAKTVVFFVVVLGLFLLISCSPKPEEACLGKWSTDDGSAKLEIIKDGSITIAEKGNTKGKYLLVGGKYSFPEKNKIAIDLDGNTTVITISVSGDEMTWTYPNGEVLKYKREK